MRVFITGATGFIGKALTRQLIARGDNVVALVRNPSKAGELAAMGAELTEGDVTDIQSLRAAMPGSDAVVHLAGIYEFGIEHLPHMRTVNVNGARNTLTLATELGIPRIIHTSTVGVFGNTHHQVVEESYHVWKSRLSSEYERTKWEAHYEVAVPLQQKGAPIIITQPGVVTGPGDTSPHALMFRFYLTRMPFMFGARSGVTWAHVDDIAEGTIRALDKGRVGESYILAGPALSYKQAFQMWEQITGIPAPKVWLPGAVAGLNARLLGLVERFGIQVPLLSSESLAALNNYTFWATADKAKKELSWQPRPVEDLFREVLEYDLTKRGKQLPSR